MPCDTQNQPGQTLTERKEEVRQAVAKLARALAIGLVKVKIGPQGALTFTGWTGGAENRVTDACAYRRIMAGNPADAAVLRREIARAEGLAGVKVNERAIAAGVHSHDGGNSWGSH